MSTAENPADCASRGLYGDEILTHSLWWHGPSWLQFSHDRWPPDNDHVPVNAPLEEKIVSVHIVQAQNEFDLATRFSSWPKLIHVTTYILRFISLCRVHLNSQTIRSQGGALTASECSAAKIFWLKRIQAEKFPTEMFALSHNHEVSVKNPILALRPFLDSDGIIRVGGRISKAPIPFETRHPILLASHPLVNLLVDQVHKRTLHAGLQLTLSTLRREYWIVRARNIVKTIIHNCVVCTRERAAIRRS